MIKVPNANYLGWRNLQSYDPSNCSALCNATSSCRSFNMCMYSEPRGRYKKPALVQTTSQCILLTCSFTPVFQRSPTLEPSWNPSSTCYNPPSTVEIMCTMWNTNITLSAVETNFGWYRGGFNVSIVGE